MSIFAYGKPKNRVIDFVYSSLQQGVSRFFWSYEDRLDLNKLKDKSWHDMDESERDCWAHAHFLLDIQPGDYVAHVNVPEYGKVTVAEVVEGYHFERDLPDGQTDGRHCLKVKDVFPFERNCPLVHPLVSSRLKLQGAHWRIYCEKEFFDSLKLLKEGIHTEYDFLSEGTSELFNIFVKKIHECNPGKSLERFLAKVFRNIPGVIDVKENGFGFKSDNGADLIVTYKNGIAWFGNEETMVVQIKSYEGLHWDTKAVDQVCTALSMYGASCGLVITTANGTKALEEAVNELSQKVNRPVYLIAGQDVARFVLTYGIDLLRSEVKK